MYISCVCVCIYRYIYTYVYTHIYNYSLKELIYKNFISSYKQKAYICINTYIFIYILYISSFKQQLHICINTYILYFGGKCIVSIRFVAVITLEANTHSESKQGKNFLNRACHSTEYGC